MTLNQSPFFPSGDPPIANSRLSRLGDERQTTTTGEEEEEKEDWTGGGVGLPTSPPRDVMPPSTYASYPTRRFDRPAGTTIRAPPRPPLQLRQRSQ